MVIWIWIFLASQCFMWATNLTCKAWRDDRAGLILWATLLVTIGTTILAFI